MFNTFMDDLRVVFSISPWTMHVLDNWPQSVHYQWKSISVAIYNVVFAYCTEECKSFIQEYYGHGRAALIELQQQMAQIMPEYLDQVDDAFLQIRQSTNEAASSYFWWFCAVIADCQGAGIQKSERKKVKQLLQSMSENNISYAATLQSFKVEVRRVKRRDDIFSTFAKIELEFLAIDENRLLEQCQGQTVMQQARNRLPYRALPARVMTEPWREPIRCSFCNQPGHMWFQCPNHPDES
jgi:hypothetical protein